MQANCHTVMNYRDTEKEESFLVVLVQPLSFLPWQVKKSAVKKVNFKTKTMHIVLCKINFKCEVFELTISF